MARPNQEAIETFISITGAPEAVTVEKLEVVFGNILIIFFVFVFKVDYRIGF